MSCDGTCVVADGRGAASIVRDLSLGPTFGGIASGVCELESVSEYLPDPPL